ncbi:FAD-dependent oxidoreductase [Christiangramia portivictoriae]|uniref:FAD-dependent oxidoreductase n=1 Tax=Christiangramia portivictoriae TaxID=326069 RepID=UPI0003FB101B|nr:FAD-dependent oxidoreductase [Christiangramia portivictoriae]
MGNFQYDVMIVGAGAAGISCALVLGSALKKPYAENRKVGILLHHRNSHLNSALLNNAFGIAPGTNGRELLEKSITHLEELYPDVELIQKEKAKEILSQAEGFQLTTNKNVYTSERIVIATGYTSPIRIKGMEEYVIPHQKAKVEKARIQLRNVDHLVAKGLYVAGTLAGWRSQYSIAAGSGAAVATDILTEWNNGEHSKIHDKLA